MAAHVGGGWKWRMWRDRRPIKVRGDYNIGMYRRDFYNVCIRDSRV